MTNPNDQGDSGAPQEPRRNFGANVPGSPRRDVRRGSFSNSYVPRRESSNVPRQGDALPPHVPASPDPNSSSASNSYAPSAGVPPQQPIPDATSSSVRNYSSIPPESTAPFQPSVSWEVPSLMDVPFERLRLGLLLLVMVPLAVFAFWPSLCDMVSTWYKQIDYGHGFFVLPLVAFFLYLRLDTYPGTCRGLCWIGLLPILFCCAIRYYAASQYMDALDQWSLLFWILGVVWFFYGTKVFFWALPSLLFLVFIFPLPYRFEVYMRNHLQQLAAQFASVLLQFCGETAIPIKNTIQLSTTELGVEAACSGIRFLVSILAIAFAAILLMRRPWWQNLLVLAIAVPLALFVNAARIAMTGLLILHCSDLLAKWVKPPQTISALADEIAGITMIFVAFGIFFAFLWYIGQVFRRVEY